METKETSSFLIQTKKLLLDISYFDIAQGYRYALSDALK